MAKLSTGFQIKEDIAVLKRYLAKSKSLKQEKRVRMLLYFKEQNGGSANSSSLCQELNITKRTLQRWKRQYRQEGIASLLSLPTRKKASLQINTPLHKAFETKLNDDKNPLLGYWHAVQWAKTEHGAEVKYHNLRKYLIKHFGTKVKRGRKSHIKKDPQAEQRFLKSFQSASNK